MHQCRAHAKVNLFLEVIARRPDGYHDIESVFTEIPLHDTVEVEPRPGTGITVEADDATLPTGPENLAVKAALALRKHVGVDKGLHIRLRKNIPSGAGLGGGSSDAAAVLILADRVWKTGLGPEGLAAVAGGIGADVAFFLRGGMCLCRGIGDVAAPMQYGLPDGVSIGLALPPLHSSTALAYRNVVLPAPGQARSALPFAEALAAGDVGAMEKLAFNRFEPSVFQALPELAKLHRELRALLGREVRMSGSGAGLWFFAEKEFRPEEKMSRWAEKNRVALVL